MTTLRRAPNGDWLSRKMIPEDVRDAYKATFGVSQEARFRAPGSTRLDTAKQQFRDWDAEVTSRIDRLRAQAKGEGLPSLTQRQAHALAGRWYAWFTKQHEDNPGDPEDWARCFDQYEAAASAFDNRLDERDGPSPPRGPKARRHIHDTLRAIGRVHAFMGEQGVPLSEAAEASFLDAVEEEFPQALRLLARRAKGDYRHDKRPERFPAADPSIARPATPDGLKPSNPADRTSSGLTCWGAFELWIEGRKPAPATINRWRAVFVSLKDTFGDRDASSVTTEEAQVWVDGLLASPERSPHVVEEVWRRAAKVVFAWAMKRKRLTSNPFAEATVALPKRPPKLREREFNETEWKTILKATLEPAPARMEPHNAAARRWVPWVCAYTGARAGEVCQLRAEDIQRHPEGFWTINITPEAGTVKGNVARVVPLHEHLVEQGFITFAQSKAGPLFYDLAGRRKQGDGSSTDVTNPVRSPWAKSVNKLSDWVRALGVTDPGISPNHAWRHTFKRRAARAGIERRIRFGFCGHTSEDEGDAYETPSVEDLAVEGQKFPRYELG
jgi:integrase